MSTADAFRRSGWLSLSKVSVKALDEEDRLVFAAIDQDGKPLHPEFREKIFQVAGRMVEEIETPTAVVAELNRLTEHDTNLLLNGIESRNTRFFQEQMDKLDRWADDLKHSFETAIKDLAADIKRVDREARLARSLQEKIDLQRRKKELQSEKSKRRKELFEAQDAIDDRKDLLLAEVEARLKQTVETTPIFTIRWRIA